MSARALEVFAPNLRYDVCGVEGNERRRAAFEVCVDTSNAPPLGEPGFERFMRAVMRLTEDMNRIISYKIG